MANTRRTTLHCDGVRVPEGIEALQLLSHFRNLIEPAFARWENADLSVSYIQCDEGQVELLVEFTFYVGDDDSQKFFNPHNTSDDSEKFPTLGEAEEVIELQLIGSYIQQDTDEDRDT